MQVYCIVVEQSNLKKSIFSLLQLSSLEVCPGQVSQNLYIWVLEELLLTVLVLVVEK